MDPQSGLGPWPTSYPKQPEGLRSTGREGRQPLLASQQAPGLRQSSCPRRNGLGEAPSQGTQKSGTLSFPGPSSRQGASFLVPTLGNTVPTTKRDLSLGRGWGLVPAILASFQVKN